MSDIPKKFVYNVLFLGINFAWINKVLYQNNIVLLNRVYIKTNMIFNIFSIFKIIMGLSLWFSYSMPSKLANTAPMATQVAIGADTLIPKSQPLFTKPIIPGAHQTAYYLPAITGKKIALVVNQTSTIGKIHLVDSLKNLGMDIKVIFAPEHGFRGDHSAGAHIKSSKDVKTGLPIISLYGNHKKPSKEDLAGIEYVIFDIQDVGARFYTYLSTMHYVMEACAEMKIPFMVLDRPNPNGFYVDGPILEPKFQSFVGMHPIPIVHGMTLGELAKMINGEGWLENGIKTDLNVIQVAYYHHNRSYKLPIKPSPNLPSQASVYLYPSLCLFEGTNVSVGRGTSTPFECFGKPGLTNRSYKFTPKAIPGIADNPPYKDKECTGALLTSFGTNYIPNSQRIYLDWLILLNEESKADQSDLFNSFFDKLAGTDKLREQIIAGKTQQEIYESWEPGLKAFKNKRKPYLLYGYLEKGGLFE